MMNKVDYLIIGGSAAGTTAADTIRTLKPNSTITIITDENHEQYSRVLLPHYVRHKVNREQMFLKKPDWYIQRHIQFVKGKKVAKLDSQNHMVTDNNGEECKYGKVLIAVGGYVVKLNVPGSELENVLFLRTVEDGDKVIEACKSAKKGVIIGGGFNSLEFATGFSANGIKEITIIVRDDYYWAGKLDRDSSRVLVKVLESHGVKVVTGQDVERIEPKQTETSKAGAVITKGGMRYEADVVGVGIGIKPDFGFLAGSNIKLDKGVVTNEYLEASVPDVYAAGDCCQFFDVVFEREHIMGNWSNATGQGLAVAKTITGEKTVFETASSYTINFFDGSCSFIGVTDEKFADKVIVRGSEDVNKISRIFIKTIDGVQRIVGATIINDPAEVSPISAAVRNRTDISEHVDKISDLNFDLKGTAPQ